MVENHVLSGRRSALKRGRLTRKPLFMPDVVMSALSGRDGTNLRWATPSESALGWGPADSFKKLDVRGARRRKTSTTAG
jgi:hypothetical protein